MNADVFEKFFCPIFTDNLGIIIDNVVIFRHVLGKYSTFTATRNTNNGEVTPLVTVEKVANGGEDKFTTDKILAFFENDLLKLGWVGGELDGGLGRWSINDYASIPSRRRKCKRPDSSPATIVTPSGATAQRYNL